MATEIVRELLRRGRRWLARSDLGRRGEGLAARELRRRGYSILDRRWRCRLGEIDLVASDRGTIVVVEVKTRSRSDFGSPADAVDLRKQKKLVRLARAYLGARRLKGVNVRFDVVGVTLASGERAKVEVYRSAFEA